MATCEIDVLPESLYGSPCSRLLRNGECPIHGDETEPKAIDHPEPTPERVIAVLSQLDEDLRG